MADQVPLSSFPPMGYMSPAAPAVLQGEVTFILKSLSSTASTQKKFCLAIFNKYLVQFLFNKS